MAFVSKLNPQQNEAVYYIDGPSLVIAGAGSGKTRVITQKIAYLIQQCGLSASSIAAVTFTNKAAKEMKERVSSLLGKDKSKGLTVSTFHTLGLKILRSDYQALGYRKNISIYDSADCQNLVKQIVPKPLLKDLSADDVLQIFSRWKNQMLSSEQLYRTVADNNAHHPFIKHYETYCSHMKSYNAVDFDDLINLPVELFKNNAEVLEKWQNKLKYILVDEYQDTNTSQYQFVKYLVGVRGALTVVGDDDQSIYAWRGAQPGNLALLREDFPTLKIIKLEQNYRSAQTILTTANHLIANNPHVFDKRLWSDKGAGEPIQIISGKDDVGEAERVVSHLIHHKFQKGSRMKDYAILFRSNHQSRIFERTLRENQIPYRLTGGISFFSYVEVKDLIAYLRLMVNDDDDQAFIRVINTPRREIGPTTIAKLAEYAGGRGVSLCTAAYEMGLQSVLPERAVEKLRQFVEWLALISDNAKRGDVLAAVKTLLKDINYSAWLEETSKDKVAYERKQENVDELVSWIEQLIDFSKEDVGLGQVLSHMMLMDILDRDDKDSNADAVSLMTLHSAKGLEFPYVYMVGMEENILPHHACLEGEQLEEERRLAYVGITRAQQKLVLSYAERRKRAGEFMSCEPSRFLQELPQDCIQWQNKQTVDPVQRQEMGRAHLSNLRGILGQT